MSPGYRESDGGNQDSSYDQDGETRCDRVSPCCSFRPFRQRLGARRDGLVLHKVEQVIGHVASSLVSACWLDVHGLVDDRRQVLRDGSAENLEPLRLPVHDLLDQLLTRRIAVGQFQREQRVQRDAQRIDIPARVGRSLKGFGRNVAGRSHDRIGCGKIATVIERLGESKIRQVDDVLRVDE